MRLARPLSVLSASESQMTHNGVYPDILEDEILLDDFLFEQSNDREKTF